MVCRSNKKFFSAQCRIGQAAAQSAHWGNPPAPIVPAAGGCGHRRAGRPVSWGSARPFPCCRHRQRWRRSAPAVWGRSGAGFPRGGHHGKVGIRVCIRQKHGGGHPGAYTHRSGLGTELRGNIGGMAYRGKRMFCRQVAPTKPVEPTRRSFAICPPLLLLIFAAKQRPALPD